MLLPFGAGSLLAAPYGIAYSIRAMKDRRIAPPKVESIILQRITVPRNARPEVTRHTSMPQGFPILSQRLARKSESRLHAYGFAKLRAYTLKEYRARSLQTQPRRAARNFMDTPRKVNHHVGQVAKNSTVAMVCGWQPGLQQKDLPILGGACI